MAKDATRRVRREARTLAEALVASLREAGRHTPGESEPPAAILWTDEDRQWMPLARLLADRMPELLELGEYNPAQRRGPAVWLKCAIAGVLDDVKLPGDKIPVLYLPGVSRQTLRAPDSCPDLWKPLVELQYRGAVWTQRNNKDWTVEAFLVSEDALALDVARDADTRKALKNALAALAEVPLASMQGKRLEAEDFDKLMVGDTVRDLLRWMSNPSGFRAKCDDGKWDAFKRSCKEKFKLDPQKDGELAAAEKLGLREGPWAEAWERFAEAPASYPGLPELLDRARPKDKMAFDKSAWPSGNQEDEAALRKALNALDGKGALEARQQLLKLEKEHGKRREWVWALLGQSPLADAMVHLEELATCCETTPGGAKRDDMARHYAETGYRADLAVIRALATAKSGADLKAVGAAVRAIYLPWLQDSAAHFQKLVAEEPLPTIQNTDVVAVDEHTCLLFADGLRFDIAQPLVDALRARQLEVESGWRWAAAPTVTATAKFAVSPVAKALSGTALGEAFNCEVKATGSACDGYNFKKLLKEAGIEVLDAGQYGSPSKPKARAWCEFGQIDHLGHEMGIGMAAQVQPQIDLLVERIANLLEHGWQEVKVVTDHGWLLMPGGLPKVDLPKYLTQSRWSRCATIKGNALVEVPKSPWFWNPDEYWASPPGVRCFVEGNQYAHGGLSLQECVIPVLNIKSGAAAASSASIEHVQWVGLRCRVEVQTQAKDLSADIRTKANDPESSLLPGKKAKLLDEHGKVGLIIEDEDFMESAAKLVILDSSMRLVAKQDVTIGGES